MIQLSLDPHKDLYHQKCQVNCYRISEDFCILKIITFLHIVEICYFIKFMSTEEIKHTKSRNPENFTFLDKESLSRYTTDTGKILPIKYSGLTPMQQRKISKLIKKSRHMQLSL